MNIIFLGSFFIPSLLNTIEVRSRGNIQYASNNHQWQIIKGLANNFHINHFHILSAPMIGSYPLFFKQCYITEKHYKFENRINIKSIGFINIPLFKNCLIKKSLYSELKSTLIQNKKDKTTIIVYGMHTAYMKAAIDAKKIDKSVRICLIVPDLPNFMNNSEGFIWKIREYIEPNRYNLLKFIDSFILLTEQMADLLSINTRPWIRLEGIADPSEINRTNIKKNKNKIILLYSGTLAFRFGILELLEVFHWIKETHFELWICGAGEAEHHIKNASIKDNRIKYFGLIPRQDVLILQQKATILINPRTSLGEYTKYSFPSKTMEYMLSGTPLIMRKLPGIPNEYDPYIFYTSDDSKESLYNKILEVSQIQNDALIKFGLEAQHFVIYKKNFIAQGKKMADFIKSN